MRVKKKHVLAPPTDTQETPGGRCLIFDPGICSSEVRMPSGLSRSVVHAHGVAVTAHMTTGQAVRKRICSRLHLSQVTSSSST